MSDAAGRGRIGFLKLAGVSLAGLAGVCALPVVACGWGSYGHQMINERAVDDLPAAMWDDGFHNGFNAWRAFISTHSTDPGSRYSRRQNEIFFKASWAFDLAAWLP